MAPALTPCFSQIRATAPVSSTPRGKSHCTWSATVGQEPVRRWTKPASATFSSVVTAAAGCTYFPKRVPVLANPHDGNSIRKASSAAETRSVTASPEEGIGQTSVNRNDVTGRLRAPAAGEPDDRVRAIGWQNRPARDRAPGVEVREHRA